MYIKNIIPQTKQIFSTVLILVVLMMLGNCASEAPSKSAKKTITNLKNAKKDFEIISPSSYQSVTIGEPFEIKLKSRKGALLDSAIAKYNNRNLEIASDSENLRYLCNPGTSIAGKMNVSITLYYSDTLSESHLVKILHLPKEEPKSLSYQVVRSFSHDPEAYTQGLLYLDGSLYESTGQPNRSSVRALNPINGEVIRKKALAPQYFGEGIAIIDQEIFMLTYRARIGFVFDLKTFELKRTFNLQTQEGWGLTTYNDTLIMSDGTASLYFLLADEYGTLVGQKEICTNKGLVNQLNELEYTPSGLYSNVYGQNIIYKINLATGIVTHTLDLSKLFPDDVRPDSDHVLNGIAYNKDSDTFYVTGKQWPVMYEIRISPN